MPTITQSDIGVFVHECLTGPNLARIPFGLSLASYAELSRAVREATSSARYSQEIRVESQSGETWSVLVERFSDRTASTLWVHESLHK